MTPTAAAAPPLETARFLESMASPDPAARRAAATFARRRGASALPGLADLAASSDKAVAKAAQKAMTEITHHAARPGAPGEARQVADALLVIAQATARPRMVRAHALHLAGFVASTATAPALRALRTDKEVGEDARMAWERIGGKAAKE